MLPSRRLVRPASDNDFELTKLQNNFANHQQRLLELNQEQGA